MAHNIKTTQKLFENEVIYSEVAGIQRSYTSTGNLIFDADGKSIKLESDEGSGLSALFVGPTEFALGLNYSSPSLNTGLISISSGSNGDNWISLNVSGESVIWSFDNSASSSSYSSVNDKSPLFLSTKVADLSSIGTIQNAVVAGMASGKPDQSNTLFLQEARLRSSLNMGASPNWLFLSDMDTSVTGHIGYLKDNDFATTSIAATDAGLNKITITGFYSGYLTTGRQFEISGGTFAGTWTVISATQVASTTEVIVAETVGSTTTSPAGTVKVYLHYNDIVFATDITNNQGAQVEISDYEAKLGVSDTTDSNYGHIDITYQPTIDEIQLKLLAVSQGDSYLTLSNQGSAGNQSIAISTTNAIQVEDDATQTGMFYDGDYSTNGIANHPDRWIPDAAWVTSQIPAGNTFGETYFVEPGGDDATGEVGNINKAFQTILGAVDQAVADALTNPLIYVFPGTYPEDSIQFDGSFFFTPGVVVTGRPGYHGTTGIVTADPGTSTFTTPGNFGSHFNVPGKKFRVTGSTSNDGIYTVVSAADSGPNTDIIVVETIPSAIANGRLSDGMGIFYCGPVSSTYLLYGNAALNCKVYGELTVDRAETLDGDWPGGAIDIGQDGDMFVECHSITMEQGIGVYMQDNAKLTLTGEFFEVEKSGYGATVRDTSESVFIFQRIKHSGLGGGFIGNCFFIRNGSTGGFSGTCRVEAEELIADGGASALQFSNTLAGAIIYIEATDMDTSTWAINNQNHFGGEIKIVGNVRSPLGIFNTGSSGYLKFTGDLVANANSTSFNDINSGNVYINGDIYHDSTPTAISEMVKCDGGTLRINGKISNTTTGGFGINKTGGTLVLDTVKVIADSDSVTAATAQDIKVIHSLAVNTAVNANITNAIIGSSIITDAGIE